MKKLKKILLLLSLTSCSFFNTEINGDKVIVNETTKEYTFKENNKKVTGTVVFYELDPKTSKKFKQSVREVVDGKRVNKGFDYYPSGSIEMEYQFDKNGLITGLLKSYYENSQIWATREYEDNKEDGVSKEFREDGTQSKETEFKNGVKIKEYEFDESGKKLIPANEKLELVSYETGFYEFRNSDNYQLLFQPMVILKWKNISNEPISEAIKMEVVFIDNSKSEEWSKDSNYFQGYSDAPIQIGISKQISFQSSVGFQSSYAISIADISCQIFINKQLFKSIKIKNDFLTSNRIQ